MKKKQKTPDKISFSQKEIEDLQKKIQENKLSEKELQTLLKKSLQAKQDAKTNNDILDQRKKDLIKENKINEIIEANNQTNKIINLMGKTTIHLFKVFFRLNDSEDIEWS